MIVLESGWLQGNTQHPGAIDKIRNLEAPKQRLQGEVEPSYDLPTFTQHLNNIEVLEKGTVVFECKVEPTKDPTMKIGNVLHRTNIGFKRCI